MRDSGPVVVEYNAMCIGSVIPQPPCVKGGSMPKRRCSRSLARKGTSAAAAKRRRHQEYTQQRDSWLALARLTHSLASNLQVPLWCHQGSVMEAQSSERRRRAAIKGAP